jgi:hypothetical protein
MVSIIGEARLGSMVRYRPNFDGARRQGYSAQIVRCEAYRELVWRGAPFHLPALAWGEHWFRVERSPEGTLFEHGEYFGGSAISATLESVSHSKRAGFNPFSRIGYARKPEDFGITRY